MTAPSPRNVPELFLERVGRTPDVVAFRHPDVAGGWRSLTWEETEQRVRAVASGLRAVGFAPGEVGAILASTRIEWILADFGILFAAGATTTIYPSSTAEECGFILADSGAAGRVRRGRRAGGEARRRVAGSCRGCATSSSSTATGSSDGWVLPFAGLEERGREWDRAHPGQFEEAAQAIPGDALATVIYTSGTTGKPKGVELTHDCWVTQSAAIEAVGHPRRARPLAALLAPARPLLREDDRHGAAAHRVSHRHRRPRREAGGEPRASSGPTFVCAVPRIFEKVRNKALQSARDGGAAKDRDLPVGDRDRAGGRRLERAGGRPGALLAAQRLLADRLVYSKVRALFGGRLRFFISGSAPLSRDVAEFFDAVGVVILEGYGLTESSAATHCNRPGSNRVGTVGPAAARRSRCGSPRTARC